MRLAAVFLCLTAVPLWAETIVTDSKISAVTVYPAGASVTRVVRFDAGAGAHEIVITDLPPDTEPQALRLTPAEGVQIGAWVLRSDRVIPREPQKSPAQIAAEAALEAAQDATVAAQVNRDGVAARMTAAQAQIDYLSRLGAGEGKVEAEALQATGRMISAEVLTASQALLAARLDLPAMDRALTRAREAQDNAQAALDALTQPGEEYATLSLSVVTSAEGPQQLEVTQMVQNAAWSPLYDAALDRAAGQVTLDRSLLVSQSSGEDWTDVALTLSTAQPGNRAEPSGLRPPLHRIEDPVPVELDDRFAGGMAEPMAESMVVAASKMSVQFQGDIVSYAYPGLVDIADGVENLRLPLDRVTLPAQVQARAVPRYDETAFVMAKLTNTSGEVLLPGPVFLTRDGAFVGEAEFATVAPGAVATLGFGAVEGLRLKRLVPARAQGDRGLFTKSNQFEETAVLSVENLTAEAWDIRLMDMVPYSEQEDLVITYIADPPVTDGDVEGTRGLLAWNLAVKAGATQKVTLTTRQSWPEGKDLHQGGSY